MSAILAQMRLATEKAEVAWPSNGPLWAKEILGFEPSLLDSRLRSRASHSPKTRMHPLALAQGYGHLAGQKLNVPDRIKLNAKALQYRWECFQVAFGISSLERPKPRLISLTEGSRPILWST
jgi:hypothetical protein